MKRVRFTCDNCGKPVAAGCLGRQRINCLMYTTGYGMQDGEHTVRGHICSVKCGLRMLKNWLAEIEGSDGNGDASRDNDGG